MSGLEYLNKEYFNFYALDFHLKLLSVNQSETYHTAIVITR